MPAPPTHPPMPATPRQHARARHDRACTPARPNHSQQTPSRTRRPCGRSLGRLRDEARARPCLSQIRRATESPGSAPWYRHWRTATPPQTRQHSDTDPRDSWPKPAPAPLQPPATRPQTAPAPPRRSPSKTHPDRAETPDNASQQATDTPPPRSQTAPQTPSTPAPPHHSAPQRPTQARSKTAPHHAAPRRRPLSAEQTQNRESSPAHPDRPTDSWDVHQSAAPRRHATRRTRQPLPVPTATTPTAPRQQATSDTQQPQSPRQRQDTTPRRDTPHP